VLDLFWVNHSLTVVASWGMEGVFTFIIKQPIGDEISANNWFLVVDQGSCFDICSGKDSQAVEGIVLCEWLHLAYPLGEFLTGIDHEKICIECIDEIW
jgi:hypothetical protein